MEKQIKSKKRVADHGEVFTAEREVNAMLDLVKDESERIDSTFLEPACGTGNFLKPILLRKLTTVKRRYHKSPEDYEKYSVEAMCNIYGVELLEDNVKECRRNLYEIWEKAYKENCAQKIDEDLKKSIQFILERNILCGDALTMLQNNGTPIIFSEWRMLGNTQIQRKDYLLNVLLEPEKTHIKGKKAKNAKQTDESIFFEEDGQITLFDDAAFEKGEPEPVAETSEITEESRNFYLKQHIPQPIGKAVITDYRKVWQIHE